MTAKSRQVNLKKAIDERCQAVITIWKPFFAEILIHIRNRKRQTIIKEVNNYIQNEGGFDHGIDDPLKRAGVAPYWSDYLPIFIRFRYDSKILENLEFLRDPPARHLFSDRPMRIALGIGINLEQNSSPSIRIESGHFFGGYYDYPGRDFTLALKAENLLALKQAKPTGSYQSYREGTYTDYDIRNAGELEKLVMGQAPNLLHIQGLDYGPSLRASLLFMEKLLKTPVHLIKQKSKEQMKKARTDYYTMTEKLFDFLSTQKRRKDPPIEGISYYPPGTCIGPLISERHKYGLNPDD